MLPLAPFGERGARPVIFPVTQSKEALVDVLAIPGVGWSPGYIFAAWDVAWRVAEVLNYVIPPAPTEAGVDAPGMLRYEALGFREILRRYQKDCALFLLRRAWAIVALPQRTGKTLVAIAAIVALGAKRVLVLAPGAAKWVWVKEIVKWTKDPVVVLDGRGGREARVYCYTCKGTGLVEESWCPDCKQLNGQSYGYKIVEVREVARATTDFPPLSPRRGPKANARSPSMRLNLLRPPPMGPRYPRPAEIKAMNASAATYRCSIHADVTADKPGRLCLRCRAVMLKLLEEAAFVLANYDIMVSQEHYTEEGESLGPRPDLLGWSPILQKISFEVAVLDESRELRGRPDKDRRGRSRRDKVLKALARVQRVWCLDGTPVGGFTRDLWGPLDVASNGLFGRPWRSYDERYCLGHYNSRGKWDADGRSILAETELKRRIQLCIFRRERSEIAPELPEMQFSTIRLDPLSAIAAVDMSGDEDEVFGRVASSTLDHKIDVIVENVLAQIAEGNGVYVLTFHPASATRICRAIEEAMKKPQAAPLMHAVNARVFLAVGKNPKARVEFAEQYVNHLKSGAGGVWVSTHDSMRGAISLYGVNFVHVAELHHNADTLMQAITRPNEMTITRGLNIDVYIVKGSKDENQLSKLGVKFDTQIVLMGDESAAAAKKGMLGVRLTSEEIFRRLTAHLE